MYRTAIMLAGWLRNTFRSNYEHMCNMNSFFMQTREYAARKGTREKARKKKVKVVIQKVGFIPHILRESKIKQKVKRTSPLEYIDDSWRGKPIYDVWFLRYHPKPCYSLKEAIENHRETHHPTMYNAPNALVNAVFELNLQKEKQRKTMEKLTKLVETPHPFDVYNERTILALCKTPTDIAHATAAGADFVGGVEVIKQIQAGNFNYKEYQYIVAHVDIAPDLLLIRGLLRSKFPNIKSGSLGTDMNKIIKKFKQGMIYNLTPDHDFKEYGVIDCPFGTLNMDIEHLEANFKALIEDINSNKPRQHEDFILRVRVASSPSRKRYKLDHSTYIPVKAKQSQIEKEEEVGEDEDPLEDVIIASQ